MRGRRLEISGFFKPAAVRLALFAAILSLAACSSMHRGSGNFASAPVDPVQSKSLAPGQGGSQIGSGPVKVALILPLTQAGSPSVVGTSLRNAAALAMSEAGTAKNNITLQIEDDQATAAGATAAAQTAVANGASLIIGPLFSPNVRAVAQLAGPAHIPVIAFSTDATVAQPGVYLLSFLVQTYVDRIVNYAVAHGKTSFAALMPNNDYGRIAEAEFQQVTAQHGVRVMEIDHYDPETIGAAVKKVAALGNRINALFIPDQAAAMPAVARALAANGINSHKVQILGTGLWNDARVLSLPALQGAWFAAPDNTGFEAFAKRYRAKFNSDPTRIATLSYDAVSLAVALAQQPGPNHFSASVLTNHAGFNGADGVFRFEANGLNQRGLAVMAIRKGMAVQLSPAPHVLSASGT